MKPEVTIGQVWKEKDKRFTRYVVVVGWRQETNARGPRIRTCLPTGEILIHGRVTSIAIENLQTRFELISQ